MAEERLGIPRSRKEPTAPGLALPLTRFGGLVSHLGLEKKKGGGG